MVRSLLNIGVFAARRVDTDPQDYTDLEDDTDLEDNIPPKAVDKDLDVQISEIPLAVDNYLSVTEALLNADVDPMNSLSFVPRDFVFRKKELQEKTKMALQKVSNDATKIIHVVQDVIWEEVKLQRNQKRSNNKRKATELYPDALVDSSDGDSEIYLGDGLSGSSKRVRPTESHPS
jgi:hypothetical protein